MFVTFLIYFCDTMLSTEKRIRQLVCRHPRGKIWFPIDFSELGTSDSVRKALERLVKKEVLNRVGHGIYTRPKMHRLTGKMIPQAETVVEAIGRRDRVLTMPSGAYALNAVGLSTQVPMKLVFLTNGTAKTVKVGNQIIRLKKTAQRYLSARGEISKIVIQALRAAGQGNLTVEEEKKMVALLKKETPSLLRHDIKLAPAWIRDIMKRALDGKDMV